MAKRGLFIVLEGIDGAGKSVQIDRLKSVLTQKGIKTATMRFPDRETGVGSFISTYLQGITPDVSRECLHLLFSANRWEKQKELADVLEAGTTVLCDRYAYSGVAYSVAVHGLSFTWCLQADKGLLKPDVVYQIATEPSVCAKRHGYGNEVYERQHIQERVAEAYSLFHTADNWKVIQPCSADCLAASHQPSTEQHPEQAQRKTSAQEMSIDQSINSVTQQILEHLLPLLEHSSEHSEQVRPPLARLGDAVSW